MKTDKITQALIQAKQGKHKEITWHLADVAQETSCPQDVKDAIGDLFSTIGAEDVKIVLGDVKEEVWTPLSGETIPTIRVKHTDRIPDAIDFLLKWGAIAPKGKKKAVSGQANH